jgi:hypothetical protein
MSNDDRAFLYVPPKDAELLSVALAYFVFEQRRVIEVDSLKLPPAVRQVLVPRLERDVALAGELLQRVRDLAGKSQSVPA